MGRLENYIENGNTEFNKLTINSTNYVFHSTHCFFGLKHGC